MRNQSKTGRPGYELKSLRHISDSRKVFNVSLVQLSFRFTKKFPKLFPLCFAEFGGSEQVSKVHEASFHIGDMTIIRRQKIALHTALPHPGEAGARRRGCYLDTKFQSLTVYSADRAHGAHRLRDGLP